MGVCRSNPFEFAARITFRRPDHYSATDDAGTAVTNQDVNLVIVDDPGGVIRSQITSVVCQIQRFDFDFNLLIVTQDSKLTRLQTLARYDTRVLQC